MNINIPPDSEDWLFAPAPIDEGRLWSFRWPPPCEIGDALLFRFDGRIVASAVVHSILKPGDHDGVAHHGKRFLQGHKVVWLNSSFRDLRAEPSLVARIEAMLKRDRRKKSHV